RRATWDTARARAIAGSGAPRRGGARVILCDRTAALVPSAVGRQIGLRVPRLGVGQRLLVPVRVARGGKPEHRPLTGRRPLNDLEPLSTRRALGPRDSAGPARCPHVVVG